MYSYSAFMQSFMTSVIVVIFFILPLVAWTFFICALIWGNLMVKLLLIAYMAYTIIHHNIYNSVLDGNGWMSIRNGSCFRYVTDYFPIELRKTAELPPNRHYILAHYPHGLIAATVSTSLIFNISPWLQQFPGLRPKLATLNVNFYTPFVRELLRLLGYVPSSKRALTYYLTRPIEATDPHNKDGFTSNIVGLAVGGAREAKDSKPGQYIITLKERKGFVKLAIETGAYIVPSFGFGEVDICTELESRWLRPIQAIILKVFGFYLTMLSGRITGLLPYRKRIGFVVGSPIAVQRAENPDQEYVDEIHRQFTTAICDLFDTYKGDYLENSAQIKLFIK